MFSSISSSPSPPSLTHSLQRQYQHVCQREREAAVRNRSLVRDVAKLKTRLEMASLCSREARAQRLAVLKGQYETYVKSTYVKSTYSDLLAETPPTKSLAAFQEYPSVAHTSTVPKHTSLPRHGVKVHPPMQQPDPLIDVMEIPPELQTPFTSVPQTLPTSETSCPPKVLPELQTTSTSEPTSQPQTLPTSETSCSPDIPTDLRTPPTSATSSPKSLPTSESGSQPASPTAIPPEAGTVLPSSPPLTEFPLREPPQSETLAPLEPPKIQPSDLQPSSAAAWLPVSLPSKHSAASEPHPSSPVVARESDPLMNSSTASTPPPVAGPQVPWDGQGGSLPAWDGQGGSLPAWDGQGGSLPVAGGTIISQEVAVTTITVLTTSSLLANAAITATTDVNGPGGTSVPVTTPSPPVASVQTTGNTFAPPMATTNGTTTPVTTPSPPVASVGNTFAPPMATADQDSLLWSQNSEIVVSELSSSSLSDLSLPGVDNSLRNSILQNVGVDNSLPKDVSLPEDAGSAPLPQGSGSVPAPSLLQGSGSVPAPSLSQGSGSVPAPSLPQGSGSMPAPSLSRGSGSVPTPSLPQGSAHNSMLLDLSSTSTSSVTSQFAVTPATKAPPTDAAVPLPIIHTPSGETHSSPEAAASHDLVGSTPEKEDTSWCLSASSGTTSADDIEKELLLALEVGVADTDRLSPVSGSTAEPQGGSEGESSGRGYESSEGAESIPPSSRLGWAASREASLKRRLGLVSSEDDSDSDQDQLLPVKPHPLTPLSDPKEEEEEFDFN